MDIGTFFVLRVIIHEIPKSRLAEKDEHPIRFSDTPSPLDEAKKTYFRRRITRSLQHAFDVERDPMQPETVPALMVGFFLGTQTDEEFVSASQGIATHLHLSQGGSSSAGLVAMVEGTIGTGRQAGRCLAVLKLEMEPGVHIEQTEIDGKKTFEVTVEDVTLTETTRVFKASLFPRCKDATQLRGIVSDDQLESTTIGRDISEFFLKKFLGCRMAANPAELTKEFAEKATRYFNAIDDDEVKIHYEMALRAELGSPTPTINPEDFARQRLGTSDRDGFVALFRDTDGRVASIEKDVGRVQKLLDEAWVFLNNGVRLIGPPAAVERVITAIRTATTEDGELIAPTSIRKIR